MEVAAEHWVIIINPKSGKKKFRKQRKDLFDLLKHKGISFEYRLTGFAGHATKIARYFVERNYKNFLVLGGDGTMSEVINGIFSSNIQDSSSLNIALIPRGTGNDWGRFWGITQNHNNSMEVFLKGKTHTIDIGKVEYTMEGEKEFHYFINSLGFGLDAAVVHLTQRLKNIVGSHSFLYSISLLLAVFKYRAHRVEIHSAEMNLSESLFTMSIANGCYSGGGLKQCPNALPYDGLLDIMVAKKPTFFDIIGALVYLFKGKLLEHSVIESFQSTDLLIKCGENMKMEADGIVVNSSAPYKISIIPSAIQMIVP